jgi:hypothetical protein
MDNSTATPPLQGELLLLNQLELVTPTTVGGTLYGIAFTLFCLYVHSLAPQLRDGDRKRQAKFMLVYSTVIMLCGVYSLVYNAWGNQDAYIKHSDFPGGPYGYIQSINRGNAAVTILFTSQVVIDILTSAIQVHCFFFSHLSYKTAESRARFGVYGSFGVLLNMPVWLLCFPYCVS